LENKIEIKLTKKDFWLAILAGEASAWLSLPILKNLKIFDILAERGINAVSFSVFWILQEVDYLGELFLSLLSASNILEGDATDLVIWMYHPRL